MLNNIRTRIHYLGGTDQQKRMNVDKLKSLRKALSYSYQAATAVLSDGREFRCLINPNKLSVDLDNKILSIPFEACPINGIVRDEPNFDNNDLGFEIDYDKEGMWSDMAPVDCLPDSVPSKPLSSYEMQPVGLREGDVIEWKENGSHWLIYLQRLEETAYFRADLRRCRYQIELENGSKYWVYVKGPSEKNSSWYSIGDTTFNKLNYTLQLYITKNDETQKYFHRFAKININERPWEVQAIDDISTPGLIEVHLKESFSNIYETNLEEAVQSSVKVTQVDETEEPYIYGTLEVYPYETHTYEIKNCVTTQKGTWSVENLSKKNIIKIIDSNEKVIKINIMTGKSGSFELIYKTPQEKIIAAQKIKIKSL